MGFFICRKFAKVDKTHFGTDQLNSGWFSFETSSFKAIQLVTLQKIIYLKYFIICLFELN